MTGAETRFALPDRTDPVRARRFATLLQADADERWHYYEQLAAIHRRMPSAPTGSGEGDPPAG